MNTKDPRDFALFSAMPLVQMPRFGTLPPLEEGRTRLLIAQDGLYIEAKSHALWACARLAAVPGLPYGACTAGWRSVTEVPKTLLCQAEELAREALPNEWAGAVIVDHGQPRLIVPRVHDASPERIRYDATTIDPLTLLLDVHSHGRLDAFFSSQDDTDDLANPCPVFFAAVIGAVQGDCARWVTRLVIGGRAFSPDDLHSGEHLAYRGARRE